jgi:hypothetical protein
VSRIEFEWDEAKNLSNQRKHGVSFEEASQVFRDPLHVSILERVAHGEERWKTFGAVAELSLLVVAHTLYDDSEDDAVEVVRIISAREVTREERRIYEEENG